MPLIGLIAFGGVSVVFVAAALVARFFWRRIDPIRHNSSAHDLYNRSVQIISCATGAFVALFSASLLVWGIFLLTSN
jgi:hypothetical protein